MACWFRQENVVLNVFKDDSLGSVCKLITIIIEVTMKVLKSAGVALFIRVTRWCPYIYASCILRSSEKRRLTNKFFLHFNFLVA